MSSTDAKLCTSLPSPSSPVEAVGLDFGAILGTAFQTSIQFLIVVLPTMLTQK